MKRALAVLGAILMIALSVMVRDAIEGNDSGNNSTAASGPVTIACVPELEPQCRALKGVTVRIEDAADTARALARGTAAVDGWVTLDPWPAMAEVLAQHDIDVKTTPLASSELTIAMVKERAVALAPRCGGAGDRVTWRCLGDNAGKDWTTLGGREDEGQLKLALPPPTTAAGALLLGDAATSYFGRVDFASNDFDDAFLVWKAKVLSSPGTFSEFLQQFPARFSAVGAVRALADPGARESEVSFTSDGAFAVAVLSDVTGRASKFTGELQRQLLAAGWEPAKASNLPGAGVLLALTGVTG